MHARRVDGWGGTHERGTQKPGELALDPVEKLMNRERGPRASSLRFDFTLPAALSIHLVPSPTSGL